jgi:GxxExxY protein
MALEQESGLGRMVIGAAIEVHRHLGPGLLESAYQRCLVKELETRGLSVAREVAVPMRYKGEDIGTAYRIDLLIENTLIVELKSVESLHPIHIAQLLTYLRLTNKPVGLLINFNTVLLKDGIRRVLLPSP